MKTVSGGLPIYEDVARAYIDGRNEGRQSERRHIREKVKAMRNSAQGADYRVAYGAVLALLDGPDTKLPQEPR